MIYLIQTVDDRIVHDFSFELQNSIRYQKEFQNRYDIDYRECSLDVLKTLIQYNEEYVPVGTVEFVNSYFNKFFKYNLTPINIPDCLNEYKYTKRKVFHFDYLSEYKKNTKYFIKDHEVIKREEFPKVDTLDTITDDHTYQVSEVIDIESEYRCFVHNNELVDVRRYSGKFDILPDFDYIRRVIDQYSSHNPPKAYTLDVGINNEKGTFIIEIHDFYSCGLYGFSNYNKLPFMCSQWYYDKVKRIK